MAHVALAKNQTNKFLKYADVVYIGMLRAHERRFISIPMSNKNQFIKGDWVFEVKFNALEKELAERHTFTITTREEPKVLIIRSANTTTILAHRTSLMWVGFWIGVDFSLFGGVHEEKY